MLPLKCSYIGLCLRLIYLMALVESKPASPDFFVKCQQNVSEYRCCRVPCPDAEATLIGVFMNQGNETVTKSLGNVSFGVQVLHPHNVNYEALEKSIWEQDALKTRFDASLRFDATKLTIGRNITLAGRTAAVLFQLHATCGYKSETGSLEVEKAVRVHSIAFEPYGTNPFVGELSLQDGCKYRTDEHWIDDEGRGFVRNPGASPLSVELNFVEGMQISFSPEKYDMSDQRKDDTGEMLTWINSQISGVSLDIDPRVGLGLNWAHKFKPVTEYGFQPSNLTVLVPANRSVKFFQTYAVCGGEVVVNSWIFPVFLPLSADFNYKGECESPEFEPLCVFKRDLLVAHPIVVLIAGSPETALRCGGCNDSYEEIRVTDGATKIQVEYGIKGPWKDKLGGSFRAKLVEALREVDVAGVESVDTESDVPPTNYNWTTFEVTDWAEYLAANTTLTLPPLVQGAHHLRVFQLVGECASLYSLHTQTIVYVQLDKDNRCVQVSGVKSVTCEVMQKWVDLTDGPLHPE